MEASLSVADLVDGQGLWCLERIKHLLPDDIIQHILAISPPNPRGTCDRVPWKLSKDGEFTTTSAYEYTVRQPENLQSDLFKSIWSWSGPERIRMHLWKMAHGALVTNVFRLDRGIVDSGCCPICNIEEESIIHMSRDCVKASQVWNLLAHNNLPHVFFVLDFQTWLFVNLKSNLVIHGLPWVVLFGARASGLW